MSVKWMEWNVRDVLKVSCRWFLCIFYFSLLYFVCVRVRLTEWVSWSVFVSVWVTVQYLLLPQRTNPAQRKWLVEHFICFDGVWCCRRRHAFSKCMAYNTVVVVVLQSTCMVMKSFEFAPPQKLPMYTTIFCYACMFMCMRARVCVNAVATI